MARSVSASAFRTLLHCPHALHLDHHGNAEQRSTTSEFEEFLRAEGRRFEQAILRDKDYVRPEYPESDFSAGAAATLELMTAGVPLIYQGVLQSGRYVGVPDLLRKLPGGSTLGDWHYEPCEIKLSTAVREPHVLQLCFYGFLLEQVQGRRPETAGVIVADGTNHIVFLAAKWLEFERRLAEVEAIIDGRQATSLAIFSGCRECDWESHCQREAVESNDVTLVAGLKRDLKPALVATGIRTIRDLAEAEPAQLHQLRGVGLKSAGRLVRQAKAQAENCVISLSPASLPDSDLELYYDIEGEPGLDVDYLHGLLVVGRGQEPRYMSFVAEQPGGEGQGQAADRRSADEIAPDLVIRRKVTGKDAIARIPADGIGRPNHICVNGKVQPNPRGAVRNRGSSHGVESDIIAGEHVLACTGSLKQHAMTEVA